MRELKIRASSIGKIMGEPRSKSAGPLSETAKTYIRQLASEAIFGIDFEIDGKELQKGIECEDESIALYNRVYGRALAKNQERRTDEYFSGESDLPDVDEVVDIKTAWSLKTFPLSRDDMAEAQAKLYEYQLRAYMRLWDKPRARLAYCMVNTPDRLIGYESILIHVVNHIPEHQRVTTWVVDRDMEIEAAMIEKVGHARSYFNQVVNDFERNHSVSPGGIVINVREKIVEQPPARPAIDPSTIEF